MRLNKTWTEEIKQMKMYILFPRCCCENERNACITPKIWSWLMELFIWLVNVCIFKSQKRMELSAVCRRFCIIVQCYIVFTERICQQIYECIRNRIKYLLFFCIFKSDIFHCRLRAISKSMPYAIDCWQIGNLCKVVDFEREKTPIALHIFSFHVSHYVSFLYICIQ